MHLTYLYILRYIMYLLCCCRRIQQKATVLRTLLENSVRRVARMELRMTMTKRQRDTPPTGTAVLVFHHGGHKVADSRLGSLGTIGIDCLVLVLWSLLLQ
jgi:hypothetical protein